MADKDADNFLEIHQKYGPGFEAMKKTWVLMALKKGGNGDIDADYLIDELGSYERFYNVQQAWGFFEAMLSIPEATALKLIAAANEEPED